jgi:hypothetical protein
LGSPQLSLQQSLRTDRHRINMPQQSTQTIDPKYCEILTFDGIGTSNFFSFLTRESPDILNPFPDDKGKLIFLHYQPWYYLVEKVCICKIQDSTIVHYAGADEDLKFAWQLRNLRVMEKLHPNRYNFVLHYQRVAQNRHLQRQQQNTQNNSGTCSTANAQEVFRAAQQQQPSTSAENRVRFNAVEMPRIRVLVPMTQRDKAMHSYCGKIQLPTNPLKRRAANSHSNTPAVKAAKVNEEIKRQYDAAAAMLELAGLVNSAPQSRATAPAARVLRSSTGSSSSTQ